MPPIVWIVLNGLSAALTAAPQVTDLAVKAKDFFKAMTGAKIITKEQADAINDRVDAICEAALDGKLPPSWDVEADPE